MIEFPEYVPEAVLGTTVLSGDFRAEYNKVFSKPIDRRILAGYCTYRFHPLAGDVFQIEVFSKTASDSSMKSALYMVNLPVDRWYNLSLEKVLEHDNSINLTKDENNLEISLTCLRTGCEQCLRHSCEIPEDFQCFQWGPQYDWGHVSEGAG